MAGVDPEGALTTNQPTASMPFGATLSVVDTAYNFFRPVRGQSYEVTSIIIGSDKDIGPDGAIVVIYEATSAASLVATKTLLSMQILRNTVVPLTGLHWAVTEGWFINVKTNDATVYVTIAARFHCTCAENPAQLGIGASV